MSAFASFTNHRLTTAALTIAILSGAAFLRTTSFAQVAQPNPQTNASDQTQALQDQITELKEQVTKLQAALQSKSKAPATMKKGMSGKGQMGMGMEKEDSMEMGAMGSSNNMGGSSQQSGSMAPMHDDKGEMGSMKGPMGDSMKGGMGKKGMAMSKSDSGCCGMGSMGKPMGGKPAGMSGGAMNGTSPSSATSGGSSMSGSGEAPSLLHLGSKDFFLDHANHVGLTAEQKANLEKLKMTAADQKAASQRQIDQAEAELWQLTSANQPDTNAVDKKVQEIAKLRADQQTAYIHAVSDAAKVLTPQQQEAMLKPMSNGR